MDGGGDASAAALRSCTEKQRISKKEGQEHGKTFTIGGCAWFGAAVPILATRGAIGLKRLNQNACSHGVEPLVFTLGTNNDHTFQTSVETWCVYVCVNSGPAQNKCILFLQMGKLTGFDCRTRLHRIPTVGGRGGGRHDSG